MTSTPRHFLVLHLCLSLATISASATAVPATTTTTAAALIEKTCKLTDHPDVCISALTPEPLAHQAADAKRLASIVVGLAFKNATETGGYIMGLLDQTKSSQVEDQCLADCADDYELAMQELDDAVAALDDRVTDPAASQHAIKWVQEALSQVKECPVEGCNETVEHKEAMTKRNGDFAKLCSIALSIIKSLPA